MMQILCEMTHMLIDEVLQSSCNNVVKISCCQTICAENQAIYDPHGNTWGDIFVLLSTKSNDGHNKILQLYLS